MRKKRGIKGGGEESGRTMTKMRSSRMKAGELGKITKWEMTMWRSRGGNEGHTENDK